MHVAFQDYDDDKREQQRVFFQYRRAAQFSYIKSNGRGKFQSRISIISEQSRHHHP
jgi:hypothetical protein